MSIAMGVHSKLSPLNTWTIHHIFSVPDWGRLQKKKHQETKHPQVVSC